MLSFEFMGVLALWVLWVNTLLIAGAALIDLRRLGSGVRGVRVLRGRIEAASSEGSPFAQLSVSRTGRIADGPTLSIQFGAQKPESSLHGGTVRVGETAMLVREVPCRVWLDPEIIAHKLAHFTEAELPEAEEAARKRRGLQRTTDLPLEVGDDVYLAGRFEQTESGLVASASDNAPLLVSTIDPRAFIARQTAKTVSFLVAMVLVLALITGLASSEPLFGPLSKLGGVLGLAYFLLVLPAATWLRERTAAPDRRSYFGYWKTGRPARVKGEPNLAPPPVA
jgi:hypothetical protein